MLGILGRFLQTWLPILVNRAIYQYFPYTDTGYAGDLWVLSTDLATHTGYPVHRYNRTYKVIGMNGR